MTRLVFLSPVEKRQFDLPPVLTHDQRPAYFVMTDDIRRSLNALRTPTNKVGFMLQLGYFKHSGKFFAPHTFRSRDIKFLKALLQVTEPLDFSDYPPARVKQQRNRILSILDWNAFDGDSAAQIAHHVQLQVEQQIKPEQVFATGGLKSNGTASYVNDKKLSPNSINRQYCLRIAENRYKRQLFGTDFSV